MMGGMGGRGRGRNMGDGFGGEWGPGGGGNRFDGTTYIVPADKQDQLIQWLEINAVRPGQKPIGEIKEGQYTGRQLINE